MIEDGFSRPLTEVGDQTLLTKRPTRHADIPSMQDQPVMSMAFIFRRYNAVELHLDLKRRLAGCNAGSVADTEDMGVDCNRRLTKRNVEHDICGLAADARQRLQRLARARDLSAMLLHDPLRQFDEIPGFGAEEADGLDQLLHAFLAKGSDLFRRVGGGKQTGGRLVYASNGRPPREAHRPA